MPQVLVTEQYLDDIADAIRSKNGSESTYTPAQMAGAIEDINTAADEAVLVQKTVNANGQYNALDDSADGYSRVMVNVPNSYIASDEGKVVSGGALVGQTSRNVMTNGTYDTTENNEVVVNVPSGGGGGTLSRKATYRVGNENGVIVESELSQTIEMHNQNTDFIIPTLYGMNYAFKKNEPFEISCKFKILNAPTSMGEQVWGGVNSYYNYPSIGVYPDKIAYFVTTDGSTWQYSAVAITPPGYTPPINTIIIARLTFDGTNISFYVNDGSNEYTAELENVTPSGGNFAFEFGGQNRSQYSIAKLGCVIYLDETYIKVGDDIVWPVGVATLVSKTVTQNGTYNASGDNADGYSSVTVNVSGGGGSYPVADAFLNGRLSTIINSGNYAYGSYLQTDSQHVRKFLMSYARDKFGSTKGTSRAYGVIAQEVAITQSDLQGTLQAFAAKFPVLSSAEYYGYVCNQAQILSDIGAVLLGDFSQGGEATGNALSDSISNYSAVLLQGIYNGTRNSDFNTSMLYVLPELNTAYWAGMKDRNNSYDCNVTFTDDQTVSLTGNNQVIIYGIL